MRSLIISIILFCSSGFCIAQEIHPIKNDGSCDDQNYKLSLFKTNDALFSASHCITIHNEEIDEINGIDGIEEIIHNSILVNGKKYELKSFRKENSPSRKINLEAVSVYKNNRHPPLLITLFSEEFCCYPQPEGKDYTIHLYQIYKGEENSKIQIISVDHILGKNVSGYDGGSDVKTKFKLKNIREIKKYLNKKKALLNQCIE
ncbi:hypothetical protein ACMYUL_06565 [Neisseria sp. CP9]|jgi:hypothetical protein|uniref:hypothetical protein n=1 Tax=unclassified Neisseria TaxID=2623750 RepID=UPI0008A354A1|nr:hypothetical protein [Neisseria sp. HMSC077D05]OFN27490.1 hypothetical protein HMPREF2600_03115 [Neisseria sp. HMSC077D05]